MEPGEARGGVSRGRHRAALEVKALLEELAVGAAFEPVLRKWRVSDSAWQSRVQTLRRPRTRPATTAPLPFQIAHSGEAQGLLLVGPVAK